MGTRISAVARMPAPAAMLVDVGKLLAAYAELRPDPAQPEQRITFGTSGHRGISFERSFNEGHVLAITQAICDYRHGQGIDGPLYLGIDSHALSQAAFDTALEVLAANKVETMIAPGGEFTPTPAISHAVLVHNRRCARGLADGIVITPSHNLPQWGGFKYNPPNGGQADTRVTTWIEQRANTLLEAGLRAVQRLPLVQARRAATLHEHDFLTAYVADLGAVIDLAAIRNAGVRIGVDPLGGAGVHYWARIAERYGLDLTAVSEQVDPQFGFMPMDWDGQIRMDPSSSYAMQRLIALKERYGIALACDTDHDRHGIVTPGQGLLPPNHHLSV
jgi:phosphoglucomutase